MSPCPTCGGELEPIPGVGWLCPDHPGAGSASGSPAPSAEPDGFAPREVTPRELIQPPVPPEAVAPATFAFAVIRQPDGSVFINATGVPCDAVVDALEKALPIARKFAARVAYARWMAKGARLN